MHTLKEKNEHYSFFDRDLKGIMRPKFYIQGLRLCFVFFNLALTDRNIQARFGLRVVWEF